ncbi:MAG: hypothetical protein U0R80_04745 [Nocardioidaceae bacterium]
MSAPSPRQRARVFVHVGSPKTGTTFLQNVLWSQRATAREQGLLLPMDRFHDHFLATLDVRGLSRLPVHPDRAIGMWDRMVARSVAWDGTVLISHELFAAADLAQAERAMSSLLRDSGEVHVVLTARDLVRQLTAEWQEHVKHRSTKTLQQFVADVRADVARDSWFWKVQDFDHVLARWGSLLPPERVHVVTVPPAGTPAELLWSRFASVLGLDADAFTTDLPRSNSSLGVEQAELLRRVNEALGDRLPIPGPYPLVVKNVLAHGILEQRRGTPLALTDDDASFASARSADIAERLAGRGFDVVGDLAELVPAARTGSGAASYWTPSDEELTADAVAVIADLMAVLDKRSGGGKDFEELARAARTRPVRFALAQAARKHALLGRAERAYRRARRGRG